MNAHWRLAERKRLSFLNEQNDEDILLGEEVLDTVMPARSHGLFDVVHWSRLPMFDWDVAKPGVYDPFKLNAEELPILNSRLTELVKERGYGLRMYRTPGGFRAFVTHTTLHRKEWVELANWLHVDVFYVHINMRLRPFCWACRVGPKPGRKNDFIARLMWQKGSISPLLGKYVTMHDSLVAERKAC